MFKILVIDDEESALKMLRLLLGGYGYSVTTASNGREGLEKFGSEKPDLVITDVKMPGMDGIEVLKKIKDDTPEIEVIVVTGHGDMETAIEALKNDASDFITKPIQKDALEIALKRAEERAETRGLLKDYTENLEREVKEATAELERTCHQLQTLCEINKKVGELLRVEEVVEFIGREVDKMTSLSSRGMLVLNSRRDGLCIWGAEGGGMITPELVEMVKSLKVERILTLEDMERFGIFGGWGESERCLLIPIIHDGTQPVAALMLGVSGEDPRKEDIHIISIFLSQTAGAIRRVKRQEEDLDQLRKRLKDTRIGGDIVGSHKKILQIHELIDSIADSDATVLIQGESGTGKELVARRIHELSPRKDGPFVVINCAAFPQTLLESELFGHVKGAFTGAVRDKRGSFERADHGTIFLDEIGEVPFAAQVKLLRVLQFREFQRLGDEKNIQVDVRILTATSRDLRKEMAAGNFREDLYYRLHVIPIELPPLRERMSDLPLLVDHFINKLSMRTGKKVSGLAPEVLEVLTGYSWPGNIRELENVIEHALVLCKEGIIRREDLPASLASSEVGEPGGHISLKEHEKRYLLKVLEECEGNKNKAIEILKIGRSTLYRKLEEYGVR